ncbi:low affinity iron permease family protein [Luteolibacter ambystomatis]|uniref:Low affinity iron permease family protein n=1 Tax=Luteolibacter ambystomatis TaxID=2824561 RepID=A0A975PGY4_9BACT|nr:low affinity iron permease family protein [Luteolibacter ambystomatis]QUE53213.1 low affinity iron permease family protein [Luteolibacter ambystomatis]
MEESVQWWDMWWKRFSFARVARSAARLCGNPWSFLAAVLLVAIWALVGPLAGFSETWQLVINTATTIVTFLAVFLIQASQNHEMQAVELKVDELLKAVQPADNGLINLDELDERQLEVLHARFFRQARAVKRKGGAGSDDSGLTLPPQE